MQKCDIDLVIFHSYIDELNAGILHKFALH